MKSHTKIFLFAKLDTWLSKALVSLDSVNPLYLTVNTINEYKEESNGNKYTTLVSTDESKDTLKKYDELWNKIRDLIGSVTNNSNNYDEKHVKIKFNSYVDLPPKKTLELYSMVIVVRTVFMRVTNTIHKLF